MFEGRPRHLLEGDEIKRTVQVVSPQTMPLQRDSSFQALRRACSNSRGLLKLCVEFPGVKAGLYLCDFDPFQRLLRSKVAPVKLHIEQRTVAMPHFSDAAVMRIQDPYIMLVTASNNSGWHKISNVVVRVAGQSPVIVLNV